MLLGVGEAVGRTLNLVDKIERPTKTRTHSHDETLDDSTTTLSEEVQHLLSFWTLFFSLSLLETLRKSPSRSSSLRTSSSISTRFRSTLQRLRYTYLRFLRLWIVPVFYRSRYFYLSLASSHPRFDLSSRIPKFPTVPFASQFSHLLSSTTYLSPRTMIRPSSFPQPLPASSDLSKLSNIPLPHTWFATSSRTTRLTKEVRWQVVKVLVLWCGLRRDSFGAKSFVFDWVLGPVVKRWRDAASEKDEEELQRFIEENRVGRARNRGRVGGNQEDYRTTATGTAPEEQDNAEPPSPTSSTHSYSPRPPPIWTTQTPPRLPSKSRDHPSSRKSDQFPTRDNIPYRLASSTHPLLNAYSVGSSIESEEGSEGSKTTRKHRRTRTGRDSLLMESPPRSLLDHRQRTRSSSSSEATSEEEEEEELGGKEFESPPRTEAEEGIQRWSTVLRLQNSLSDLDVVKSLNIEGGEEEGVEVRGLEAVGRGWSV